MSASPITIMGRLTADPELKFLTNGTAVVNFGVAVNHYWKDNDGEKKEEVYFYNVTAWRYLAEHSGNVLVKGTPVVVAGRLKQRSWENDEGKKIYAIELLADDIGVSVNGMDSFKRRERDDKEGSTSGSSSKSKSSSSKSSSSKPQSRQAPQDEEPF